MNAATLFDPAPYTMSPTACPACTGEHAAAECPHGVALELDLYAAGRLVIIVPCSADKAPGIHTAAGELHTAGTRYTGTFHRYAREHAARLGADVVILSAALGLVALDRIAPDYDVKMSDDDSIEHGTGPRRVADQAAALGLLDPGTTVVGFLPNRYAAVALAAIPHLVNPLAAARGIGDQRGRIARLTRTELLEAAR